MQHQLVVLVNAERMTQVNVKLGILGKSDIKKAVMALVVLLGTKGLGAQRQQVARRLDIGLEGRIVLRPRIAKSYLGNKEVLIVISQESVARVVIIQLSR